jgi:hypothetical protein
MRRVGSRRGRRSVRTSNCRQTVPSRAPRVFDGSRGCDRGGPHDLRRSLGIAREPVEVTLPDQRPRARRSSTPARAHTSCRRRIARDTRDIALLDRSRSRVRAPCPRPDVGRFLAHAIDARDLRNVRVHLPALLAEGSAANRALFAFRPRRHPTQPSRRGPLRVRLLRIWVADDTPPSPCVVRVRSGVKIPNICGSPDISVGASNGRRTRLLRRPRGIVA